MKKDSIILTLLLATSVATMAVTSIFAPKNDTSTEQTSWTEFCKARGYDPASEDEKTIAEYLDTWVGSVEEERAFNHLPAQEN